MTLASVESRRERHSRRAGLTLLELLVVLSVIGLLLALVLPAIGQARAAARRTACQNNLRQLGLAMQMSADTHRRYPASGNWGDHERGDFDPYRSWVVDLLPWLDQATLYEKWNLKESCVATVNFEIGQRRLEVLVCRDDDSAQGGGDLSYVVNGGWGYTVAWNGVADCPVGIDGLPIDLNGDGQTCPPPNQPPGQPSDRQIYFQTGLMFAQNWPVKPNTRHHSPASVTDGLTQTIQMVENIRTGTDPRAPSRNWSTPFAELTSMFLAPTICQEWSCIEGQVDYARANLGEYAINAGLNQEEGRAPFPSSRHPGGVFAVFCDGRVVFLSEKLEGRVYAALVSPQGGQLRGPLREATVDPP